LGNKVTLKRVIKIVDVKDGGFDADYWAKKSPKKT